MRSLFLLCCLLGAVWADTMITQEGTVAGGTASGDRVQASKNKFKETFSNPSEGDELGTRFGGSRRGSGMAPKFPGAELGLNIKPGQALFNLPNLHNLVPNLNQQQATGVRFGGSSPQAVPGLNLGLVPGQPLFVPPNLQGAMPNPANPRPTTTEEDKTRNDTSRT